MRFSPRFLDELRDRVGLGELVGRRVKLARAGRELKGLCPFHNEKTPSFHVVEDKGFYHCFGCGAHGDAIDFLIETEGLGFAEAVAELAARAGLELPKPDPEEATRAAQQADLHQVMEAATLFFEAALGKPEGRAARDYLAGRGLQPRTVPDFRLGFAPESRHALRTALEARGIAVEQMVEAGLLKRPEDGGAPFDYFRNRIVFPIADRRGRVVAFGGRSLDPDNRAKYLNSPDTPLFRKGSLLYNLARARKAAHETGKLVVVEGYMDVIALAEAGIEHVVAPLGTALTEEQFGELWKLAPEPVLCFDGDAAGAGAAMRAAERALPLLAPGQSLRFARLPQGLDPDDLARREGAAAIEAVCAGAVGLADMLWQGLVEGVDLATPERRAGLDKRSMALLGKIADDKVRSFYIKEFRDRLYRLFAPPRRAVPGRRPSAAGRAAQRDAGRPSLLRATRLGRTMPFADTAAHEELLMLCMLAEPELAERHVEELGALAFVDGELDKLRRELLVTAGSAQGLEREALHDHLARNGFAEVLARLAGSSRTPFAGDGAVDRRRLVRHVLARLRRLALERDIAAAEAVCGEGGNEAAWQRLIALKRELERAEGNEADDDPVASLPAGAPGGGH